MGLLDRLLGREQFSQQWSISNPAFAAWLRGEDDAGESVTPYTVLGLSAVIRAVQLISTTIAGLPLHSYERQGDAKARMPSDFDDPYPTIEGMTPFAWKETVLIHLLLWRHAFLWHERRGDGSAGVAYRPILPDAFTRVWRQDGKRRFDYRDPNGFETRTVGSEQVTYIPGPSLDGTAGHPLLSAARSVFSSALSGDKTAQRILRRSIRISALISAAEGEEPFDEEDGKAIEEKLGDSIGGSDNAGKMAVINRHLKVTPWSMTNIDAQWIETKQAVLGDIERLFGVPPHLLADIEKQTSWGTGVAEQNLSLARYTLRGWSDRIQEVLSIRLPRGPREQFCEFDYAGLLQGTPEQEIKLLIEQVKSGLLTVDEARKIRNLPPLTAAQKADMTPAIAVNGNGRIPQEVVA